MLKQTVPQPEIEIGPRIIVVKLDSLSHPGKHHTVTVNRYTRECTCTCEAGRHGRRCYHITSVYAIAAAGGYIYKRNRRAPKVIDADVEVLDFIPTSRPSKMAQGVRA